MAEETNNDRNNGNDDSDGGRPYPEGARGLARMIAKAGYASRRQAEEMVRSGRVEVDRRRVLDPFMPVGPDAAIIIDGQPVVEIIRQYFAFHKPPAVATSTHGGKRTRLITEFFPNDVPSLRCAGRLDASTTGLLLISNDSSWNANAAGGCGFEKEFLVTVSGSVAEAEIGVIAAGMTLPKVGTLHPTLAALEAREEKSSVVRLALNEGKVRQVRHLFTALRHDILAIHRVRIGPVSLGELAEGHLRPLSAIEIAAIRDARRVG